MLIAFYGLFHMSINNPFIAAILTVVGYSINDTIVIFDRVRENLGLMGRTPLPDLIDTSINQTLVRSLMTSLTTILAILPLVIMGGETIRQFAVPLMVGILCGAASSIFIASPIYYELTAIGSGGPGGKHRSKYMDNQARKQRGQGSEGAEGETQTGAGSPAGSAGAKGKGKQSKAKRSSKTGGAVV
jgi:SecD/SecF fusion protein